MAQGRWFEILEYLEPTKLKDAIKHAPNHVPSPKRGGTDGFRFLKDGNDIGAAVDNLDGMFRNGFDVLIWLNNSTFSQELSRVAKYLGLNDCNNKDLLVNTHPASYSYTPRVPSEQELENRKKSLNKIWSESFVLHSNKASLARHYFQNRGLDLSKLNLRELSKNIRFHPNCTFWHKGKYYGSYPAIVSLVKNARNKAVTIHRTYLDHSGNKLKLNIDGKDIGTKKFMTSCVAEKISGSAIRLGNPKKVLHIAEGLETALSVSQAIKQDVWICGNSKLVAMLNVEGVEVIYDWADKDRSYENKTAGTDAALDLSLRMKKLGIEVIPLFPEDPIPDGAKSVDWNDVLVKHGEEPFNKILRDFQCQYPFLWQLQQEQYARGYLL